MLLYHTQHIKSIFNMLIKVYLINLILNFLTHDLQILNDMKLQILEFYNEFKMIVVNLLLLNF